MDSALLIYRKVLIGFFIYGIVLIQQGETACLFECYNNGTVVTRDDFCECACPAQFTGLLCETELLPSKWPDGPYALLMPTSGCPESTRNGWGAGFIHFTTKHKMEIRRQQSNDDVQNMSFAEPTSELAGNFKPYSFELKFCFKHPNTSVNNAALLQDLNVTVFGVKEGCPRGFKEEVNHLSLPPLQSWWTDGYLPYFDIRNDSNDMVLVTKHCHSIESVDSTDVKYDRPFISVKEYGIHCPLSMKEYDILEETLQVYSTSADSIEERHQTTLSFCVYKPTSKIDLHPSSWPNGPYAVSMLNTGCPEPLNHGWEVGYITLKVPPSDKRGNDQDGCGKVMLMENINPNYFQLFFCYKYGQQDYKNETQWPQGTYAFFEAGDGCPEGFNSSFVYLKKKGVQSWTSTGLLPNFNVVCPGGYCEIDISVCERVGEDTEISSDWIKPFALIQPYSVFGCADGLMAADGFRIKSAWIYSFYECLYIPIETAKNDNDGIDFRCKDGNYIKLAHLCDRDKDCSRGEDEENCNYNCYRDHLACNNKCWLIQELCASVQNCTESVEYRCLQYMDEDCNEYEFKCGSGECVKKIHVCDHIKDCQDGSDELFDNCDQKCPWNSFYCGENECISKSRLCDGNADCENHEQDENENICPSMCPPDRLYMGWQFRSNTQISVCMETDEDADSETTYGFEKFCQYRNRCARIKELCDELIPIQGQDQGHGGDELLKTSGCLKEAESKAECSFWSSLPYFQPSSSYNLLAHKMENMNYCRGTLGLMDGSIRDSQLSASSYRTGHQPDMSRPSKNSWCPSTNETNPYLEVALDYVSIINGVILYNSMEIRGSVMDNFYTPEVVPIGCESFTVEYAIFRNRFRPYPNKFFEIDTSLKIDKPQRFIFLRPVLARYVRIYPLQNILEGPLCLRLDLFGCAQSGFYPTRISLNRLEETSVHVPLGGYHNLTSEFRLPNKIYRWSIKVPEGGYIKLSFLNINLYDQSGMQTNRHCPRDMITFNDLFEPITAQHNDLTPIYPTDKTALVMSFISCDKELIGTYGFSVQLKTEAIPTIWMQVRDSNINEGILITYSLLGLFVNLPKTQTWSLQSDVYGRPLLLYFQTFNVACNSDNELSIKSTMYTEHDLCNTGRRPRKVYKEWYIDIGFVYSEGVSRYNPEGFSAVFQIEPVSKYNEWFKMNETYEPTVHIGQFGVYTVYSSKVKKHYRFGYRTGFENWVSQAKYCQRLNYSLVVIHDREEMEFLQAWLFFRISQLFSTSMARSGAFPESREWSPYKRYYAHIGLLRYRGISGLKEIWQDGTSPSFTAWDMGEPKKVNANSCTAMAVNMTTGKVHWHTRACNETTHWRDDRLVSLCEKSVDDTLNVSGRNQGNQTTITPQQTPSLVRCNSTEWLSDLAVCDGFLDCQDGSDEIGCHLHSVDSCSENMFECHSGECIHIGQVCDSIPDCNDESDEYCSKKACKAGEFRCENKQCIPNYHRCNAVEDCIDGSDEKYCTTCNKTTAFPCGDLTCTDLSLTCDSIPNCGTGRDEADCERVYKTCLDYWNAGYEENVVIDNPDHYVECHYHVDGEELSITASVDLKLIWKLFKKKLKTKIMVDDFRGFGICSLEIYLGCPFDKHLCKPANISIDISNRFHGEKYKQSPGYYKFTRTDALISIDIDPPHNIKFKIGPAFCSMGFSVPYIRCGDGKTTASSRKCLYDINRVGVIDGCRNMKHLDNCGSFICPVGYFKCPSSFCLAQRHLCDGERQCPGGEDETDCWCEGRGNITVLIYNEEDKGILPTIHQFARQLYSTQVAVYTFGYTFDTTYNVFVVRKTPVHPYNEYFYMDEVELFYASIFLLYDEICNTFKAPTGINVINIEQYEWHYYKGDFRKSTNIDHVYTVSEESSLKEKVTMTTKGNESTIKLHSWKILSANGIALFPALCPENMASPCNNQFRCASSKVCLPVNHICDGIPHCPFGDDETMCDFKCHPKCKCDLYLAECQSVNFTQEDFSEIDSTVRILDLSENDMNGTLLIPKRFYYLVKLFAKSCGIKYVANNTFLNANNIIYLDLSFNKIRTITKNMFYGLNHLEVLQLDGNFYIESIQPRSFRMLTHLTSLAIVKTKIREILPETFVGLTVETLNISCNEITKIHQGSFKNLSAEVIDFSRNEIETFDKEFFSGIKTDELATIISPAYKFCCVKPQSLPDDNCYPKQDEFSSCEDLMRNPILQTLVWVLGAAAVVANGCTVFYRVYHDRNSLKTGFGMFVTNLAVSDSLMGFYMLIIAVADITFRNRYMMMDDYWRNSIWCDFAGVLATVSSEASVLFMFLITLDRILVIKYPFGQWKFTAKSSNIATVVSWTISWIIALVPIIIKDYFEGRFYSISGVCLALPLTHRRPPGWLYSFLIYVALNFVAFILIAIGQLVIFLEIRKTAKRMKKVRSKRRNDVQIAKNLLYVLATDFLCWFPVGVMAIMAASGYVIPGAVYAWTAVLIVPVNAALNPFLYTLSTAMREKASGTNINTSAIRDDKSFRDNKVQCNIGVGQTMVPETPNVLVNTPLDEVPPEQVLFEPRDVLKAYISIARNMTALHGRNQVNADFKIGDVLYSSKGKKIQICQQFPVRAGPMGDKEKDIYDAGHVLRYMLKFTKSSK